MRLRAFISLLAALASPLTARAAIEAQPEQPPAPAAAPMPILTQPPELLTYVPPEYPRDLAARAIAGEAVLFIDIDAHGNVERVELVRASEPAFAAPALEAASQLRFRAAEIDGHPAAIRIEYRYVFEPSLPEPDAIAGAQVAPPEKPAVLSLFGVVREAGSRRPITRAALAIDGQVRAETDERGTYEIRGLVPGAHELRITSPFHDAYTTREEIETGSALRANYYLVPRARSPFETVVRARTERREVAKVELAREELSKIPGTFGDPVRVIENLPGMARTPGGLGGALLVRGTQPSDSRVFVDGVEVPLLYHFGGLTSVVNADMLERIDFYPGGFGARYGRATGGVVDVVTRDVRCDMPRGNLKIDVVDAGAYSCVPAGQWHMAAAARRSYIDALLPTVLDRLPLREDQGRLTVSPRYWDYQLKASRNFGSQDVDLFAFGSNDRLRLVQSGSVEDINVNVGLHIAFHRLLARHRVRLGTKTTLTSTLAPGLTSQVFSQTSAGIGLDNEVRLDIWSVDWREDFTTEVNDWLTLSAGLDAQVGTADLILQVPIQTELRTYPAPVFDFTDSQRYTESMDAYGHAYWLELVIQPAARLKLIPGARLERFDFAATQDLVLMPRLTTRYELHEGTVLKAAYGVYQKLPEPNYLVPRIGNPALDPERSQHFIVGIEQALTQIAGVDVQLYYNKRDRLVSQSQSVAFTDGQARSEIWANDGTGYSYGLEVLLRHLATPGGRFYGWVAYTLSRSMRRDHAPGSTFRVADATGTNIHDYPYNERATEEYHETYDQTHILTTVGQWTLPWGLEAGFRFRLVSGNPRTPLEDGVVYYDADTDAYGVDVSDVRRNSKRLPTFDQLDVRIDKTWTFDLWRLTLFLEVINAYNAKNVESVSYDCRYDKRVPVYLLPVLPVLGVKGEF
ncbi:MAG: TonB family protein [Myxococcota bacterium]